MERVKVTLSLTSDAVNILAENATERKRGEFISDLLVGWGRQSKTAGEPGILERIEKKVDRLLVKEG